MTEFYTEWIRYTIQKDWAFLTEMCEIIKETMTTDVTWKTFHECTDPTLIGLPQPYTSKTGAVSTYGCHILQRVFNNMKPQAWVTTAYPYILCKMLVMYNIYT